MKIFIEKELESWWATKEELEEMDDTQIIELLQEDVVAFLDGAMWTVQRDKDKIIVL